MSTDQTLQSIADVLADHEAAYHPGQLCPEDQHGHCAARPRPVPSPEDRMADARTDSPHTFRTYLDATERDQLDARAAAAEQERDDALQDRDDARQTAKDLYGTLKTIERERDQALATARRYAKTGAEALTARNAAENDLRSQTQALREALAERDEARGQLVAGVKARTTVLTDEIGRWKAKLTEARADRDDARRERDDYRQELGAAGDVLAVVRDAVERIDRALATYDTTPGEEPPSSVPSRRAQEGPTEDELAEDIDRAEDAAEVEHKTRFALAAAYTALNAAGKTCRYHGADFERLGMECGEPRCDSCKQPWRVTRALDAIGAAEARP